MKRALEWASQNNTCNYIRKKAVLPDGTFLTDGAQVPAGTEVKFLIYINNLGNTLSDISIQDVLDPAFSYVPGTLQVDNSLSECTNNACTPTEEDTIFTSVSGAGFKTDATDSDGVRYDGVDTIDVGDQNAAGNGTVDVNANSVWALLFSVTVN